MTSTPKKRLAIFTRDGETCVSCGTTQDLTIHHRINRGAGGSKLFDGYAFLLTVCTYCNSMFESDSVTAGLARDLGYKLSRNMKPPVDPTTIPVWYYKEDAYFLLDNNGKRTEY